MNAALRLLSSCKHTLKTHFVFRPMAVHVRKCNFHREVRKCASVTHCCIATTTVGVSTSRWCQCCHGDGGAREGLRWRRGKAEGQVTARDGHMGLRQEKNVLTIWAELIPWAQLPLKQATWVKGQRGTTVTAVQILLPDINETQQSELNPGLLVITSLKWLLKTDTSHLYSNSPDLSCTIPLYDHMRTLCQALIYRI